MTKEDKISKEPEEEESILSSQESSDESPSHKPESEGENKSKRLRLHKGKESRAEELQAKLSELNDKYLRLYSEFDNYRKRTMKERTELVKTASADLITSLLSVYDDLERAIKALQDHPDDTHLKEGITLIFNKFKSILEQRGLEEIKALGEPFDTDFHEAVTNIPAPSGDLKGKVVDQVEKGFVLNGKVIRYSKVVVGQ